MTDEITDLRQRRDAAAKAVTDWMDAEGSAMRLRTNDQAPAWRAYVDAENALRAAMAARELSEGAPSSHATPADAWQAWRGQEATVTVTGAGRPMKADTNPAREFERVMRVAGFEITTETKAAIDAVAAWCDEGNPT